MKIRIEPSTIYLTVMLILGVMSASHAAQPRATAQIAAGESALESFVRARLDDRHRAEITFGKLPNGTKLAPCRKIQPFLAPGARLWGRSRIGVRCISGARWTVAIPVNVRVFGEVLVATRQLRGKTPVSAGDFETNEIELTRLPGTPLTDLSAIDGQMTTRAVRQGQTLMTYHLQTEPTVSPGDPVRVQVSGRGFSVVANGSALGSGSDGKPLRVRTNAGKVIMGVLRGRTVEISM